MDILTPVTNILLGRGFGVLMKYVFITSLLLYSALVWSGAVYQEPQAFVEEAFEDDPPTVSFVWLRGDIKQNIKQIMGHKYATLRVRYWGKGSRTAWVLEEIGKERPITVGLLIEDNRLLRIKVLEYREIRGQEVRHAFFTDQFVGATLQTDSFLDRHIDSITGATLSVDALTRLAQLALYLHSTTTFAHAES